MIYPIDETIEKILASFIDEDTGEVLFSEEEMESRLELAKLDFAQMVLNLRNEVINKTAEAEAIKAEKLKLEKRQKRATDAANRAKRFLAYLTKGEKYTDGIVKISYRKSDGLVIDDRESLMAWAVDNHRFLKAPELTEGDIKQAIKNGESIPYAHLEERNNIQVK